MPRPPRPTLATDPRTFQYILNPKFEGKGLPWMRRALCARYPHQWWETYDIDSSRPAEDIIRIAHGHDKAKKICAVCPVLTECRSFALETQQPANIWGGTTPVQRNKQIRETANA